MWFILHNFTPCVRTRKTNSNLPHEKGEEIHSRKKEKKHTGSFFFSLHMMLTFLKSIIRPHFPNRKARFRGAKNPSFILKNHLFVSLFPSHLQKEKTPTSGHGSFLLFLLKKSQFFLISGKWRGGGYSSFVVENRKQHSFSLSLCCKGPFGRKSRRATTTHTFPEHQMKKK